MAKDRESKLTTQRASGRSRRAIGRPQFGEPAVGREQLLQKACELLRTVPPAQMTRAELARFAQVDPGLIRYYFKDTATLLVAAAESLCARFGHTLESFANMNSVSAEQRIRSRIAALLDLEIEQPYFNRLMIETVITSETAAAKKLLNDVTARGVAAYRSVLEEGFLNGEFRQVDGAYLYFAVIGLCEFFVSGLPVLGIATGEKPEISRFRAPYREFICELVINGLRAPLAPAIAAGQPAQASVAVKKRRAKSTPV